VITDHAPARNVVISTTSATPSNYPCKFKIIHFPVGRGFAKIINKSQGESLKIVRLDPENPRSASWGQEYAYCLFKRGDKTLFISPENGKTINVV
jgi:hypothetical protein